jgi:hypothetical protein
MVTTDLTPRPAIASDGRRVQRPLVLAGGLVLALTTVGFALGVADPGLAGSTTPHPALTGSLHDAAGIFVNNARALIAPFLLAGLRLSDTRLGRRIGDVAVIALVGANAVPVGAALGRWQGRLVPYLPQLPLEWAALTVAVSAWLLVRSGDGNLPCLTVLAAVTLALLIGAASVETWATPHKHGTASRAQVKGGGARESVPARTGRRADVATDDAPAAAVSLQGRGLPSPHHSSVPLGRSPALTGRTSTHRPPGGIT